MIEETVERFTQRIKDIVLKDERMTSIPLAYLMQLDIPDSTKHFFDQEVELWIREEEEKFTSNERFDYDMPEVRMLIDQIFDLLKQNATFHITKFNQLLERAIKLEMNYLIEPHRTLSQFLFKNSPRISTMEVYDTLKYFFRYEYYKTAISDYFNLKYMRDISQDQFEELMDQIDQKAFAENRAETTLGVVKTIMSFLSDAQEREVNSLPLDLLEHAFRDRKLDDYYALIGNVRKQSDLNELTFEQIEALIRDGIIPGAEAEEALREPTEVIGFEKVQDIEKQEVAVQVDDIEVPETQIILEEEEEEAEEEEEEEEIVLEEKAAAAPPETAEVMPAPAPEAEAEEEVNPEVAASLADHLAKQISSDTPLEDLHQMIKGRVRKKSIKKLFKKKEAEFDDFINRLNVLDTWKDASRIIDDEFYNRGINPYSKEAITLSDIIYMRFFPKDKYVTSSDDFERF